MTIHLGPLGSLPPNARVVLFVGLRDSDHLQELARIAEFKGRTAHRIEHASDLQASWFDGEVQVGVVPGATGLDYILDEIVDRLQSLSREQSAISQAEVRQ